MATGNGTSTVVTPSSIHIDVNQFKKNHIIVNLRTAKTTEEDTMIFVENTRQLEK